MATKVVMPKLGLVMEAGLVAAWRKAPGERVEPGEALVEIESDKVTTVVEARAAGVVLHLLAEPGQVIPCGTAIAFIGEPGEAIPGLDRIQAETRAAATTPAESQAREAAGRRRAPRPARTAEAAPVPSERGGDVETDGQTEQTATPPDPAPAAPAARRVARELGVDLSRVKGTGPRGRITSDDVVRAAAEARDSRGGRPGETVAMTRMRRAIADNMARSAHEVARVVLFAEVDMTHAVAFREANRKAFLAQYGADLSYNALLVKAVAGAMREDPVLNVSLADGQIRRHADVNVGLAVALESEKEDGGLVTISVKAADRKDLAAICRACAELTERARAGKLALDDVTGNSITISSLGAYDVEAFTPIVNLPEAAIVGVGAIVKRAIVKADLLAIAPTTKLSLSFDHRLVDGAPAARFLRNVKRRLESMRLD